MTSERKAAHLAARRRRHPTTTAGWYAHFRRNREKLPEVPWHLGPEIDEEEREAIASSIRAFQLGESSDGAHLLRYAQVDGARCEDPIYGEVTRFFIAEEQRHAADLARFMDRNAIALARRNWTDAVFRALRNLFRTLEGAIAVLVTAEIIAKVYYRALYRATRSRMLRRVCVRILADERAHVTFQTQQLARLRRGRHPLALAVTRACQWTLFFAAVLVVWISHARVLRRGRHPFRRYWAACWREFAVDSAAMDPRLSPNEAPGAPVPRIAWPEAL